LTRVASSTQPPKAESSAYGVAGASSLDTEGVTHRVTPEDRTKSTSVENRSDRKAIHQALASGRRDWTEQVEATTALIREAKARKLEDRGLALSRLARKAWALSGAKRDPESVTGAFMGGLVARDARGKAQASPPQQSQWHTARARGKRDLFQRVAGCADETRALRLTCRGCSEAQSIPIGCDVPMFCNACRQRAADKFRVDFQRKREGLTSAATRAGLTARFRRRALGGRFGERLCTLTVPHEGGVVDRLRLLSRAWGRFWRLLSDEFRPTLAAMPSGVFSHDPETGEAEARKVKRNVKTGQRPPQSQALSDDELSLWDLVSHLWVREWTPGSDGLGHPHLHVWIFSPYIDHELVKGLWAQALGDVLERSELGFDPIVDVRAVRDGVEYELVKYLTKEWEIDEAGVRRARPEVFAQVYAETDGQRQRQSSAGLASWAVKKISICPCCGHEAAYGAHWARVEFEFFGKTESEQLAQKREATGPPVVVPGPGVVKVSESREAELRAEYWAKRDADWAESFELRILRARFSV